MDLRYDMIDGPPGHPQDVMRSLGVTYERAVPQSLGDQWWFFGCKSVPEPRPKFLRLLRPFTHIGQYAEATANAPVVQRAEGASERTQS